MKESLDNLLQFIDDLNLRQPNGIVCFNAKIIYTVNKISKTKESEVHIITSDHLASIHLLSLEQTNDGQPDMFDIRTSSFVYVNNEYLKIESGNYLLSIFVLNKNC